MIDIPNTAADINPPALKHVYGPVSSRRYGQSLGVDLSVPKTCSFNCLFCQIGPTPATVAERNEIPPISEVLAELDFWRDSGGTADFITAAGSGEPTLHRHFGKVFRWAHEKGDCRTLLLSNGSLFWDPEVRRDAKLADVVKVSLHAWDQSSFERICRPHPTLRLDRIVEGYRKFREEFTGRLDCEVFIIPGINDSDEAATKTAELVKSFSPDYITLNTAIRPPAESGVVACPPERIRALLQLFGPNAYAGGGEPPAVTIPFSETALLNLLSRHPVSIPVLSRTFSKSESEMREILKEMKNRGLPAFAIME